jgi:hypothetical protein
MRRQRIVGAADFLGDRPGRETVRFGAHEEPEDREPARLPERRQGCERMRGRHSGSGLHGADMADDGRCAFQHRCSSG